jgi:hypothetical protein
LRFVVEPSTFPPRSLMSTRKTSTFLPWRARASRTFSDVWRGFAAVSTTISSYGGIVG